MNEFVGMVPCLMRSDALIGNEMTMYGWFSRLVCTDNAILCNTCYVIGHRAFEYTRRLVCTPRADLPGTSRPHNLETKAFEMWNSCNGILEWS
jgi:hypothetical protein